MVDEATEVTAVENADGIDWNDDAQAAQTRFKWVIEIEVAGNIVMDGFDIKDDDTLKERLMNWMPFVYGHEVAGRVLKAPPAELIRKAQGYT
jgi:hypothetical protein